MNLGTFCPLEKHWHILTPLKRIQNDQTFAGSKGRRSKIAKHAKIGEARARSPVRESPSISTTIYCLHTLIL
jgi:hypothetical protein